MKNSIIIVSLLLATASCSLLKKGEQVSQNTSADTQRIEVTGATNDLAQVISNDTTVVIESKTDTIEIIQHADSASTKSKIEAAFAPQETNDIIKDKQLNGEWTIISVSGKKINLEEMPFITFNNADGKIYGNNGCNVINGEFTTWVNKEIKFDHVLTSLRACKNMKIDNLITTAINVTKSYSYNTNGDYLYLNFLDNKKNIVMTLKRHNLDILNGAWSVNNIEGKSVKDDNIRLVIDIEESKLHGNSGCNIINGILVFDPRKNDAIQFSQLISTRMACPNMSTETALLIALEEVEFYQVKGKSEIEFFDNKHQHVLTFKRLKLDTK